MKQLLVVIVVLVGSMVAGIPVAASQEADYCEAGENEVSGPPSSDRSNVCEAPPTTEQSGLSAPTLETPAVSSFSSETRYWLGIAANQFTAYNLAGALTVSDPQVARETSDFVASRMRVIGCGTNRWLDIGWVETGWGGGQQRLFTYSNTDHQWRFYDQYALAPGDRFYVQTINIAPNTFSAELWWDGQWNRLSLHDLGSNRSCTNEAMTEMYFANGGRAALPRTSFGDGRTDFYSMGLGDTNQQDHAWTPALTPTQENVWGANNYYNTAFSTKYGSFSVKSDPPPEIHHFEVSPERGGLDTTFCASWSIGSNDQWNPNFSWGDNSASESDGCHQYSTPGRYEVTMTATDTWGGATSATQIVEVCRIPDSAACEPQPPRGASPEQLQDWARQVADDSPLGVTLTDVMVAGMQAREDLGLDPYENLTRDQRDAVIDAVDTLLLKQLEAATQPAYASVYRQVDGGGSDTDNVPILDISGAEAKVCAAEPYDCTRAAGARKDAHEWADRKYPNMRSAFGKKNAFLHCMWSALMTKRANSDFAERMGNAHEKGNPYGRRSERMDQWNNMHGRAVGRQGEDESDDWIAAHCKTRAENGKLITSLNDHRID